MNSKKPIELVTPLSDLYLVGKTTASRLKNLGLLKIEDLILYFPFRYDDFSKIINIAELKPGILATIEGRIEMISNRRTPRKRKIITEAIISDDSGSIRAIWFNQPFLIKNLKQGDSARIAGKMDETLYGIQFVSPSYEKIRGQETIHTGRLVPIYPTTEGLTQRQIRALIKQIIPHVGKLPEIIPGMILKLHKLMDRREAVRALHFPKNQTILDKARKRMAFEELYLANLRTRWTRRKLEQSRATPIPFAEKRTKKFVGDLPFKLTEGQRKSSWEILCDLKKTRPMNRLLNGEVGAGKTVIAAIAALNAAAADLKTVLMAPTEILANQHAKTFAKLFEKEPIKIGLLTRTQQNIIRKGEIESATKAKIKKAIEEDIDIIIGTHAVIQEDVSIPNLGLIIIDEQHRFGVEQRAALSGRKDKIFVPHFLSMTATPIPRSLALTIYGDLDISILSELPPGRKKTKTWVVDPLKRRRAYEYLKKQLNAGRQAFVICPLIDPSDKLGVRSATQEYEKLSRDIFTGYNIGLMHGKLKAKEKQEVMSKFVDGEIDLLVSTSVVEVGVDIPNATLMIIEDAERFGLSALHQFRGRIARGKTAGECFVFTEIENGPAPERLKEFARTNDGFKLAERDLELRGPGVVMGIQQSGFPEFKIATLNDAALLKSARDASILTLEKDPAFMNNPSLKTLFENKTTLHLE